MADVPEIRPSDPRRSAPRVREPRRTIAEGLLRVGMMLAGLMVGVGVLGARLLSGQPLGPIALLALYLAVTAFVFGLNGFAFRRLPLGWGPWLFLFSAALFGRQAGLLTEPAGGRKQLRLLWLSCGDTDRLLDAAKAFHAALEEQKVAHLWHVDSGGHTWPVWKNDLYLLSQKLFRDK